MFRGIQHFLWSKDPTPFACRIAARSRTLQLWILTTSIAVLCPLSVTAQTDDTFEREELPKLESMQRPPGFRELMDSDRFDWIVLKESETVLAVMALEPRPDTFRKRTEERATLNQRRRQTPEESARLDELRYLQVEPLDGSEGGQISFVAVLDIIGIEQLMLERVDLLIEEAKTQEAYDLLQRVDSWLPDWEEAAPRFVRLLFREAQLHIQGGRPVAALALLEQIHDQDPNYPELSEAMGQLLDPLISQAVRESNFHRARWLIRRLSSRYSDHPVVENRAGQLLEQAVEKLDEAVGHSKNGEHEVASRMALEADAMWPLSGRHRATRDEIAARHQVVRMAVRSIAGDSIFPIPVPSERRHLELVSAPIFEADSVNEVTYYRSAIVEEWDPQDLGRVVTFSLRSSQPYWESQPLISAGQVAAALAARLDPDNVLFDPRLASFIARYTVRSPSKIEIEFSRVPLNLAALFRIPVGPANAHGDGDRTAQPAPATGRFQLESQDDTQRSYHRSVPEPDGLEPGQYHVAEVVERVYATRHEAIQAFRRGHVDLLPSLQAWEVDPVRESGLANVQRQALPANHVIVFNPASTNVRNAQLRRALSFAIPREMILKKIILRDESMTYGRPSSASWFQDSYANSPLVEPPQFKLRLAFALRFAAEEQARISVRKRLLEQAREAAQLAGRKWDESAWRAANDDQLQAAVEATELPHLTMLCEADPAMQQAAEKMIEFWARIGIDVQLAVAGQSEAAVSDWDMLYRRVQMEEPLLDLWSVLLTDHSLDVNLLQGYPDWLRQDLTRLDYAGSFRVARDSLYRMQRNIAAQAFLIPLWEVDQFIAFRGNVSGYRDRPVSVYDNVQRWVVKP